MLLFTLFSHHDRQSNRKQIDIEDQIKEYYNSIKDLKFNENSFTTADIESEIDNLEVDKAIGYHNISNELIKYGKCEKLVHLLYKIYNTMIKTGQLQKTSTFH